MARRIQSAYRCLLFSVLAWHVPALAQQPTGGSSSEQPGGGTLAKPPVHQNWYGLCDAPQAAIAYPETPVPMIAGPCENYQEYTSTGTTATAANCGGYIVAFGQKGNLNPNLDHITLLAEWGGAPLTQAQCAKAKLAAVAWSARCPNDVCARNVDTKWETVGTGPKQRGGTWNSVSNACYLSVNFVSTNKKYASLGVDIIATLEENGQHVRKRAKVKIHAGHPNGKCVSLPAKTATK